MLDLGGGTGALALAHDGGDQALDPFARTLSPNVSLATQLLVAPTQWRSRVKLGTLALVRLGAATRMPVAAAPARRLLRRRGRCPTTPDEDGWGWLGRAGTRLPSFLALPNELLSMHSLRVAHATR